MAPETRQVRSEKPIFSPFNEAGARWPRKLLVQTTERPVRGAILQ